MVMDRHFSDTNLRRLLLSRLVLIESDGTKLNLYQEELKTCQWEDVRNAAPGVRIRNSTSLFILQRFSKQGNTSCVL